MKTPLIVCLCFFLLALTAQAQTTFSIGPRMGLNLSSEYVARQANSPGYRAGVEAGILAIVEHEHWVFQPALLYSQMGQAIRNGSVDFRTGMNMPNGHFDYFYLTRLHYLSLPLNVAYAWQASGQGFQLFGGPYAALLLGGHYEEYSGSNVFLYQSGAITVVAANAPENRTARDYIRRFDAGLQAGVGYRYKALLLQASFRQGLRNTAPNTYSHSQLIDQGDETYNQAFQLSLAYLAYSKSW